MNKASPVQLRKALEVANAYSKAGILFVAIPVLNDADHILLIEQAAKKIERIVEMCDGIEKTTG